MKKLRTMFLVIVVLTLSFALFMTSASADRTFLYEDFESYEVGSYPSSIVVFTPGAVQEITSMDFKAYITGNEIAAVAFQYETLAAQLMFNQGAMPASYGQEAHQMAFAGPYTPESWYDITFKIDLADQTYDLYVNDVLVANDFAVSIQEGLPANILLGAMSMSTGNTISFDDVAVYGTNGNGKGPGAKDKKNK